MIALVGRRMHQYVLDEIELGKRVALALLGADRSLTCGCGASLPCRCDTNRGDSNG